MQHTDWPQTTENPEPSDPDKGIGQHLERSSTSNGTEVRSADDSELLRSIDMIFQLQQRSEEIRTHLEKIDRVLLSSRTVAGLTRAVVSLLEVDLDLVVARILFKEDHPVASLLLWDPPEGAGIIPADFLDSEGLCGGDPFILDDLSGELSMTLFGQCSVLVASAALAVLSADHDEIGVLCLGSDEPGRYRGGMNTDIIASLADKIALGIRNAWDHEKLFEEALSAAAEGITSEAFFREALQWEFQRAWRFGRPFAVMGLSWYGIDNESIDSEELKRLIRRNVRSCDLVAEGDDVDLWVLLPEVGAEGAHTAAERLVAILRETLSGRVIVHAGLTEFSTAAAVASLLMREARLAVEEARAHVADTIVVRHVEAPDTSQESPITVGALP